MTLATHNYAVKCTAVIGKLTIVYSAVLLITMKIKGLCSGWLAIRCVSVTYERHLIRVIFNVHECRKYAIKLNHTLTGYYFLWKN